MMVDTVRMCLICQCVLRSEIPLEDTKENIKEAIELYLEDLKETGKEIPQPPHKMAEYITVAA
jgi:hypothetical protein